MSLMVCRHLQCKLSVTSTPIWSLQRWFPWPLQTSSHRRACLRLRDSPSAGSNHCSCPAAQLSRKGSLPGRWGTRTLALRLVGILSARAAAERAHHAPTAICASGSAALKATKVPLRALKFSVQPPSRHRSAPGATRCRVVTLVSTCGGGAVAVMGPAARTAIYACGGGRRARSRRTLSQSLPQALQQSCLLLASLASPRTPCRASSRPSWSSRPAALPTSAESQGSAW